MLALAAAGAGLLLARWFVAAVVAWSPQGVPRLEQARIDPMALGFAAALALASSIICGLAPALRLARTDVQTGLRDGGRGSTGGGFRDRLRAGLIVAEVALSLLLLFGAGLLIRSAFALQRVDPGFDPHGVLSARIALPQASFGDPVRIIDTFQRHGERSGVHSRRLARRRDLVCGRWGRAAAPMACCSTMEELRPQEPDPEPACASSRLTSFRRCGSRSSRAAASTPTTGATASG